MAKHEIVIHENTSASKETAPYLGSYIAKEQVRIAAFASALSAKCGLPAIQVEAILTGAFDIIEELEAESLVRIHTDLGVVCGVITGSFPTSDAPFDPEKNALELALRLDESIRLALADTVPTIATDGDLTKLRVDNAMDVEVGKPYNLIHGQGVFRVAGFNMVLDDEGAAAFLANALGTTFPLVIDEVVSKQLFMAHTAALLEPGDYKLVVKSRAGDAEGPLQTAFRRVKYLKVEPPKPKIAVTDMSASKVEEFVSASFEGENLDAVQGYEVHDETKTLGGKVKSLASGHEQEIYFSDDGHGEGFRAYADLFGVGERIQLKLTPNPERTDIDQTPAIETAVVTEG